MSLVHDVVCKDFCHDIVCRVLKIFSSFSDPARRVKLRQRTPLQAEVAGEYY